jgi:hypothetical protein
MRIIPQQIADKPLIRVCSPNCSSHSNCNQAGKRPVSSSQNIRPIGEIKTWVKSGGNYGVVPQGDDNLVIVDCDDIDFAQIVREKAPDTFTVQTGSGGYHFYFKTGDAKNQSISISGGSELGSIRWDNWHCVAPGSVHPTGDKYSVVSDIEIAEIESHTIQNIVSEGIDKSVKTGGGGGGGSLHGNKSGINKTAEDLDIEPSQEILNQLQFINSDSRRQQIAKILRHKHPERNIRVWGCSFLYSVVGLRQNQIERLLNKLAVWATDEHRVNVEIKSLVESSIDNNRADESVNLAAYIDDMSSSRNELESHKTESGSSGVEGSRTQITDGGEKMSSNSDDEPDFDFDNLESLVVYNGDSIDDVSENDRVVKVSLTGMKGRDGNNEMVDTEFVSVNKGTAVDNGDFGVAPEFNQQNSKSIGAANAEDLRLIAEGIEKMADRIEDQ